MTLQGWARRNITGMLLAALSTLTPGATGAGDDRQAVLDAQDRRFKATVDGDVDALAQMLTDDMTYTHSTAAADDKAGFLASLSSGKAAYQSIVPEERGVRLYGEAAVISGTSHVLVKTGGRDVDVRLRFTELYVKQDGAWRMALWHSTRVP